MVWFGLLQDSTQTSFYFVQYVCTVPVLPGSCAIVPTAAGLVRPVPAVPPTVTPATPSNT